MFRSINSLLRWRLGLLALLIVLVGAVLAQTAYQLHRQAAELEAYIGARAPRHAALNHLRFQLGYGGLVHHFYDYVLSGDTTLARQVFVDLGIVRAALLEYRALQPSRTELDAVRRLDGQLNAIERAMPYLERPRATQRADANMSTALSRHGIVLSEVRVAVDTLEQSLIDQTPDLTGGRYWTDLRKLRGATGLGGFIHQYKSFVLTADPHDHKAALASYDAITQIVADMRMQAGTPAEVAALSTILKTFTIYVGNLERVVQMQGRSLSPLVIDRDLFVEDGPAQSAFWTLLHAEAMRTEARAASALRRVDSLQRWALGGLLGFLVPLTVLGTHDGLRLRRAVRKWLGSISDAVEDVLGGGVVPAYTHEGLPHELRPLRDAVSRFGDALSEARDNQIMTQMIVDKLPHGVAAFDPEGDFQFCNARMPDLLEMPAAWFASTPTVSDLLLAISTRGDLGRDRDHDEALHQISNIKTLPHDTHTLLRLTTPAGRHLDLQVHRDPAGALVFSAMDVTELEEVSRQNRADACTDPLTGLENRKAFGDRARQTLAHARRGHQGVAFLAIDLDDFKPVNDTHGHAAGDQVLVEVARRLRVAIRETDYAARLGGDEFVVMLTHLDDERGALRFAHRLSNALAEPFLLASGSVAVSRASIGISVFPAHAMEVDDLMHLADKALYAAKRSPTDQVRMHGMNEEGVMSPKPACGMLAQYLPSKAAGAKAGFTPQTAVNPLERP